jgi:hypothetical protein
VEESQAAQPSWAVSARGQFGDDNALGIANDYQLRLALAIDEQADLTLGVCAKPA